MRKNAYTSTVNPCKMCQPIGACFAFKGLEGGMLLTHGSQGCSTYFRRYMGSHFNEPMDVASSALSEKSAVYGGEENLKVGISNVIKKYNPKVLGIATTCLTETIGDDVNMIVKEIPKYVDCELIPVSTPSFTGTHVDGFHRSCKSIAQNFVEPSEKHDGINIFLNLISPADIRNIRGIMEAMGVRHTLFPDYSDTLDGGRSKEFHKIPIGGTPLPKVKNMSGAKASIEFGTTIGKAFSGAEFLREKYEVLNVSTPIPIGLKNTDRFIGIIEDITGRKLPPELEKTRQRFLDAAVDGHKYLYEKRVSLYADPDMLIPLTNFCLEIGLKPVVIATGTYVENLESLVLEMDNLPEEKPAILNGVDFSEIEEVTKKREAEIIIGNSKGAHIARKMSIPLVRIGFPIHDQFGGGRILHVGYDGALQLIDRIINALIDKAQEELGVGYSYM